MVHANFYYSYRYQLADFGATFIAIDSNSLLHECRGGCQSKTPGTCAADEHRPNPTCKQSFVPKYKEQMRFLEKEIRKAKDLGDWVLVFMHHPMASIGENYGFDVGPEWGFAVLRDQVGGLLSHYNVDALFAGHEHLLELLLARPNQMPIVITGSAGYANGVLSCRVGKQCDDKLDLQYGNYKYQSKFATPLEGFADIDLSKKELTIKFIGPGAQELHRYTRVRSDKKTTLHEGL